MRTNITLDEALVAELTALTGARTKTAAVANAVKEQIRRAKLQKLASLFGKIPFDESPGEQAEAADQVREEFLKSLG